jgi:formylglycine-generating enzyme required for sulfatase activity
MLIQKAGETNGTLPPPGVPPPDWDALSVAWEQRQAFEQPQETRITLGPTVVSLGHNDYEEDDMVAIPPHEGDHEFGWDNEHPRREVQVGKFSIERSPITNGEYFKFWSVKGITTSPVSWVVKGDAVSVCNCALYIRKC